MNVQIKILSPWIYVSLRLSRCLITRKVSLVRFTLRSSSHKIVNLILGQILMIHHSKQLFNDEETLFGCKNFFHGWSKTSYFWILNWITVTTKKNLPVEIPELQYDNVARYLLRDVYTTFWFMFDSSFFSIFCNAPITISKNFMFSFDKIVYNSLSLIRHKTSYFYIDYYFPHISLDFI